MESTLSWLIEALMRKLAVRAALVLFVGACSTPYQEMGFAGGVSASRITADTYRISARGNTYTGSATIADYVLLKAAETTKQAGATHFLIGGTSDASERFVAAGGEGLIDTFMRASEHIKPGQDTIIQVMTVSVGQKTPANVLSADEIIQFVGPRVKRS